MLCWNSNWSLVVLQQNLMLTKNLAQVIWRGNGTRNANNCASSAQHEWHAGHSEPCVQQALCTSIPGPNTWALNDLCGADWSAVCQSIWHQVVLTMGCKSGCSLWNEVVCCWTCRWWWHHGSASGGPTMVVSVWHLVYLLYRGPGPASSSGTHSALTNFTFSLLQPLAGESGRQQHVVCTRDCLPCVNQVRPIVFKVPVTWTLKRGLLCVFIWFVLLSSHSHWLHVFSPQVGFLVKWNNIWTDQQTSNSSTKSISNYEQTKSEQKTVTVR